MERLSTAEGEQSRNRDTCCGHFVDGDDCFFLQAAFSLGAGEFLFMSSFPRFYHCSVVGRIVQGNKLDIPTQLLYLLKYSIILMFFCDF